MPDYREIRKIQQNTIDPKSSQRQEIDNQQVTIRFTEDMILAAMKARDSTHTGLATQ